MLKERVLVDAENIVHFSEQSDAIAAIASPGVAAAVWRRQPVCGFQYWIDRLDPARLPSARVILRPGNALKVMEQLCVAAGTPENAEREWLIGDVAALTDLYAKVVKTQYIQLRLDVETTNACTKFHVDALTARLVCTYRGRGTQYGIAHDKADPARVFTLATGAPMIVRGTQWLDSQWPRFVHRSPPIEGTGETRLLLVLDPVAASC